MPHDDAQRFLVRRDNLRESRLVSDPDAPAARPLAEGEARLRIDQFRAHLEQHHLRCLWRGDEVLGLLPHRRCRLGHHSGLGFCRGGGVVRRGRGRGRALLRLLADGALSRGAAGARRQAQLRRWCRPPRQAAGRLQPHRALRRRPGLRGGARGAAGAAEAAVHHLVPDRRLSGRRGSSSARSRCCCPVLPARRPTARRSACRCGAASRARRASWV